MTKCIIKIQPSNILKMFLKFHNCHIFTYGDLTNYIRLMLSYCDQKLINAILNSDGIVTLIDGSYQVDSKYLRELKVEFEIQEPAEKGKWGERFDLVVNRLKKFFLWLLHPINRG